MGLRTHSRPFAWIRDKEKYSHITGGLALPTFEQPGYLITMGVQHSTNIIHCMTELESSDPYEIIRQAQNIQTEYGQGVIKNWWGNPEELMSIVNEINIKGNPVLISQPIDFEIKDSFSIYTARLKTALAASYKTLFLNDCMILRNSIQSFIPDKVAKDKNNPAVNIAGGLVHTLLMTRPWEQAIEVRELIPTRHEDYAEYVSEKAIRDLEAEVFG